MNKLLKHMGVFPFVLIILSLLFVALPLSVAYAAQLFEHYKPGSTSGITIYKDYWIAQTFAADSDHSVTSLRLRFYRSLNDPGMVTVSIRGTDGSGQPNGTDLASETIAGSTLPTMWDPIGWTEIFFTIPCNLTKDQKYAIVVRAPSAIYDPDNEYLVWEGYNWPASTYVGGNVEKSSNSGLNWVSVTDADLEFEVYGDETLPPAPTRVGGEAYPVNRIVLVVPWIILAAAIIAGSVFLTRRKACK